MVSAAAADFTAVAVEADFIQLPVVGFTQHPVEADFIQLRAAAGFTRHPAAVGFIQAPVEFPAADIRAEADGAQVLAFGIQAQV
jgi:hypothetical protein